MEIIPTPPTGKGPGEWFTGDVHIDVIVPQDGRTTARAASVHFTPGARTAWHKHCHGQTSTSPKASACAEARSSGWSGATSIPAAGECLSIAPCKQSEGGQLS